MSSLDTTPIRSSSVAANAAIPGVFPDFSSNLPAAAAITVTAAVHGYTSGGWICPAGKLLDASRPPVGRTRRGQCHPRPVSSATGVIRDRCHPRPVSSATGVIRDRYIPAVQGKNQWRRYESRSLAIFDADHVAFAFEGE
ncbi:MAG: hypothetical protein ACQESR_08950 [Planctomycetota bacterium]